MVLGGVMDKTKNTVRNMRWGFLYQLVMLLFPFLIRTVILRVMGEEYVGLSGLFLAILNVMNIAELGFSGAIVFSMYEPIANNDQESICALLRYYRKVYTIIGTIVVVGGLAIMPFLKVLIKGEYPADINLYLLYLIYLLNTALGYFMFAYKTSLLTAYHRNDLVNKTGIVVNVFQYLAQIVVLFLFKNFYVYLIFLPIATILTNVGNHLISKKYYPLCVCKGNISKEKKANITKQVKGTMVTKICAMLRNSFDSIIISAFLGLTSVAMYGNYYYIMTAVHGILTIIGVSMKSGVGISLVKQSKEANYRTFKKMTFMYVWLGGWFASCLLCLYQPFMLIWTGDAKLVFENLVMILFCIYFFLLTLQDMKNVYIDAAGLWWETRYRAIIEGVLNLALNIILGYFLGVFGIILATLISFVGVNLTYGTLILFKYFFTDEKYSRYLLLQIKYTVITCLVAGVCYLVCSFLPFEGILNLLLRGIVCVILPNILYFVLYQKDPQFSDAKEFIKGRLLKRKKVSDGENL